MKHSWILLVFLIGCGGAQQGGSSEWKIGVARKVIEYTGDGVQIIDETVAEAFNDATDRAAEEAESGEEYDRMLKPWYRTEKAIRGVRNTLFSFQSSVDAAESGSRAAGARSGPDWGRVQETAACVLGAVQRLLDALEDVDVKVEAAAAKLRAAVELIVPRSLKRCPG